jgi:hypothetical protein
MSNASRHQDRKTGRVCDWKGCRRVMRRIVQGKSFCLDHADEAERLLREITAAKS